MGIIYRDANRVCLKQYWLRVICRGYLKLLLNDSKKDE